MRDTKPREHLLNSQFGGFVRPWLWLSNARANDAPARGGKRRSPLHFAGRSFRALIVLGAVASGSVINLAAQAPLSSGQELRDYRHTSWSVENGLSAVFAMQQAPDGFLWLTTAKGVFRFDGVRFESLDEVTNGAVHNAEIDYAYASPSGNVWLTTISSGLLLWKHNTVTRYPDRRCTPAQAKTENIVEDADGTLWIAASSGLYRLKSGTCELIRSNPAFPAGFPWAILLDRAGTLWVKWPVGDLYFLRRGQSEFERSSSGAGASGQRAFLKQAPDGSIWLSDLEGLRRVAGPAADMSPTAPSKSPQPSQFGDFTFGADGSLWAASSAGVHRFSSVRQYKIGEPLNAVDSQAFTVKQGLSSNVVSDLLFDKEGNIWIATFSGLDQLRRKVFTTIALPTTLERQLAIAPADDGSVWIGNREQPLSHVFKDGRIQTFPKTQNCIALRRTFDGTIWSSGTGKEHLWRISGGTPSSVAFPAGDVQSATDIAVDKNHELWISTFTPESYHRVGNTWTKLTQLLGRKPGVIGAMTGDNNGNVWFAFSRTLVRWDGREYHRFLYPDSIPMFPVYAISVRDDHVWLAGSLGIALFSHEKFRVMHWKDAQNPGKLNGLVETAAGELWANGTSGVIHLPADELKNWLAHPDYAVSADRLDVADGLPGYDVERWPEPSMVESAAGLIWFVTSKGLLWIDPADFKAKMNHVPPSVSINSIVAGGEAYLAANGLRVGPSTGNLEISYTAPSLTVPERVQFRYRLEGFDTDWQNAAGRRQAFYTNLPPRQYKFDVIARNNDGVWNDVGANFSFTILPAWYQTIWFRSLCACLSLLLLWMLYLTRLRQLERQFELTLKTRIDERVRIARDLHDTLLQGFLSASMQLDVVEDQLPAGSSTKALVQRILQMMRQVTEEGRNALQHLRLSDTGSEDLANALSKLAEECPTREIVDFRVVARGTPRPLHLDIRNEVYLIAREAVHNAFIHAQPKAVHVEISYASRFFRLLISDDGCGIDPKTLSEGKEGHWGLAGMRERSESIGARLKLRSRIGSGTELELTLPARIAFRNPHKLPKLFWWPRLLRDHSIISGNNGRSSNLP